MRTLAISLTAAALTSVLTFAAPTNAAQIFVQQSGTSPAGGDPNLITDTTAFTVGVAGSTTLQNPLLVVVGAYNGVGTPSISFSGCATPSACPAATVGTYGLTTNTATFTAASSGSAFDQLGLVSGGSENFGNWSSADTGIGLAAPSSFTLYAFSLDTNLAASSPITIDEAGAAQGSFIIAYGCDDGTGSSAGCSTNGNIGETVFTNTGLISTSKSPPPPPPPVPEPASIALLGFGLSALGLLRRKLR
jgi:hypothetical protein